MFTLTTHNVWTSKAMHFVRQTSRQTISSSRSAWRHLLMVALAMATTLPAAMAQPSITSFSDSWIRGSVPGQTNGAGYVRIKNLSANPIELIRVDSDRAQRIELHTIDRDGGVARMREVSGIRVPANGDVELAPGGYHIMFIGLKEPFSPGEKIPLTLHFEGAQPAQIQFEVMPAAYQPKDNSMPSQGHSAGHGHMRH